MGNQQQNNRQQNQQQQPRRSHSITKTTVDIEPVSVIYNLEEASIQDYLKVYFDQSGITSYSAARLQVRRQGTNPLATLYVFFDGKSDDVTPNRNRQQKSGMIPQGILERMDNGGSSISKELRNAIRPLSNGNPHVRTSNRNGQKIAYIEIDIFRVVGLMLSVDPKQHDLSITELKQLGKSILLTVQKTKRFGRVGGKSDIYADLIDNKR